MAEVWLVGSVGTWARPTGDCIQMAARTAKPVKRWCCFQLDIFPPHRRNPDETCKSSPAGIGPQNIRPPKNKNTACKIARSLVGRAKCRKVVRSGYTRFQAGGYTMSATTRCGPEVEIGERFRAVRRRTLALCEPLTPEDMMVQSISEASPAKWHLAHTAWFFETFILREFVPGYRLFNPDFPWLFNSYYQNMGHFPEKRLRSSFGRPGLDEGLGYRQHVDEAIEHLLERTPDAEPLQRIELGLNHEEQHQELLLTDILHAFFTNPLRPVYLGEAEAVGESGLRSSSSQKRTPVRSALAFQPFEGGLHEVGYGGQGFCYDNEQPRHRVWLEPYSLARRLVTCGEYAEFMADGGYRHPEFWLSTGWLAVQTQGWRAPLYWPSESGDWSLYTLRGELPLARMESAPVSHLSYFEAEAYARGAAGKRQPSGFRTVDARSSLRPRQGSKTSATPGNRNAVLWGLLGVDR